MALQKKYIEIPLAAGGLGTGVDTKIMDSPKFTAMTNAEITKEGAIELRKGYDEHSITGIGISDVTPIALAKRGAAKVVVTEDAVAEYSEGVAGWVGQENNPIPVSSESFIIRASKSYDHIGEDLCVCNDLLFIAYSTDAPSYGVIIYDPASHVIVGDTGLGQHFTSNIKLATIGDTVLAFWINSSNLYVERIDATDISSGWVGYTTVSSSCVESAFDVDYDDTYAYLACESSTANYINVFAFEVDGTTNWTNTWVGGGSGSYDAISVTKHAAEDYLLVVIADSTIVAISVVDSTDGSQDQTDTLAVTDTRNVIGYSYSATHFRFLLEHDGTPAEENYITLYSVVISSGSTVSSDSYYNMGLAHKATGYTATDQVRFGAVRAATYEAQILTLQDRDSAAWGPIPIARYSRRTVAGENPEGVVSGLGTDSNDNTWFAFSAVHNVKNEDGEITTSKALAVGMYTEDNNKRLNYAEAQNLTIFSGGWPRIWDGKYVAPLGFAHAPSIESLTSSNGTGSLDNDGVYQYVAIYEYVDSFGQVHRSAPSEAVSITLGASDDTVDVDVRTISDRIYNSTYEYVDVGIYRTDNGGEVFYRVNPQKTGSTVSADYERAIISYQDGVADSALIDNELLYTEGGVLGNDPPPPFEHCCVHKNRLFVVDAESGNLAHSKEFLTGEGIAFSDEFIIPTGHQHNRPIGLVSMDESLIVFWKDKIGVVYGDGPNDLGLGGSFTLPRIKAQIGVTEDERRSIVQTPLGIFFKSDDGIKLLDRSLQVQDIGRDVTDYNVTPIVGATLDESRHLVKFTLDHGIAITKVLVYNYMLNQWYHHHLALMQSARAIDTILWGTEHTILISGGTNRIWKQNDSIYYDYLSSLELSYTLQTNWIKLNGLQGYQRIWKFWILGEYNGLHDLLVSINYDYTESNTDTIDIDGITSSTYRPYEIKLGVPKPRCQAIRFKFYLTCTDGEDANALANLTALRLEYGVPPGGYRRKNVNG